MKQAFAAKQKIGKLGSKQSFAAAISNVYYADEGSIPKQIFSLFKLLLLTGACRTF